MSSEYKLKAIKFAFLNNLKPKLIFTAIGFPARRRENEATGMYT